MWEGYSVIMPVDDNTDQLTAALEMWVSQTVLPAAFFIAYRGSSKLSIIKDYFTINGKMNDRGLRNLKILYFDKYESLIEIMDHLYSVVQTQYAICLPSNYMPFTTTFMEVLLRKTKPNVKCVPQYLVVPPTPEQLEPYISHPEDYPLKLHPNINNLGALVHIGHKGPYKQIKPIKEAMVQIL